MIEGEKKAQNIYPPQIQLPCRYHATLFYEKVTKRDIHKDQGK